MSVNTATIIAIITSGITLLGCLYAVSTIHADVKEIWAELDIQMDQFKVQTEDLWRDMVQMGAGSAANRQRRQAYGGYGASAPAGNGGYGSPQPAPAGGFSPTGPNGSGHSGPGSQAQFHDGPNNSVNPGFQIGVSPDNTGLSGGPQCKCNAANNCPAGAQGAPGPQGDAGIPGLPGHDGIPGNDAEDISNDAPKGCFNCPAGSVGAPGPVGRPGLRGMRGPHGYPGVPGRDGFPGGPGEQGATGAPGLDGQAGEPGQRGADVDRPIPRKGLRGPTGEIGSEGPQGDRGRDGLPGIAGPQGSWGAPGSVGPAGSDGEEGAPGQPGRPGNDAEYCQCPVREGRGGHWRGGQRPGSVGGRTGSASYRKI